MKGLKKIALASTIAAVSAGAQAELKALDDAMMGELTGQAGLTIDIETQWSIGEFAYQDAGFVLLRGMSMGGNTAEANGVGGALMDNIRLTLDVAGSGTNGDNVSAYGMSTIRGLAGVIATNTTSNPELAAFGSAYAGTVAAGKFAGGTIDDSRTNNDGDLTLHFSFTDAFKNVGGFGAFAAGAGTLFNDGATSRTFDTLTWNEAVDIVSTAVDFEFKIDEIALAASDYEVGAGLGNQAASTAQQTTLISDLKMSGYMGPMDIIIQNNGNGSNAAGEADSKILWDSYVKVTDLDLYIDIAGVALQDIKIWNDRGDLNGIDGNTSFGFAHSKREIYAMTGNVLNLKDAATNGTPYVSGIAINTQFAGDIDIGKISFGSANATSIGKIFMTDVASTTNWTISAHE